MSIRIEPKEYITDPSIYPGMNLADVLEARGISQADLARRMDKPVQAVNEIVMGKKEIIPDTAILLEHVLGLPAGYWLKLESNYRESLARDKELAELNSQVELARAYPYKEMETFEWVKPVSSAVDKVKELLRWLGVANLNLVELQYAAAFRKSNKHIVSKEKLVAWLRHGELELQNKELDTFDRDKCSDLMNDIRGLTRLNIQIAHKQAQMLCAKNGIALVFTPEFKSFPVSGATRWISGKPLVQVSLRFKKDDQLWFSIFHELGHVFKHKKEFFLEKTGRFDEVDSEETEADLFAANALIPEDKYLDFIAKRTYIAAPAIRNFSESIGIAPGIVVGRLQREGKIPFSMFNHLRISLAWKKGDS